MPLAGFQGSALRRRRDIRNAEREKMRRGRVGKINSWTLTMADRD